MKKWHYIMLLAAALCLWGAAQKVDKQEGHREAAGTITPASTWLSSNAPSRGTAAGGAGGTAGTGTGGITGADADAEAGGLADTSGVIRQVLRVGGIAIGDDLKTVLLMKGDPLLTEQAPEREQERVLVYEDCRIGLYDQFVRYVTVPDTAEQIELNGRLVPMNSEELLRTLGQPDFLAEDGYVYKYGHTALKLMRLEGSDQLGSVHFFHVRAV